MFLLAIDVVIRFDRLNEQKKVDWYWSQRYYTPHRENL